MAFVKLERLLAKECFLYACLLSLVLITVAFLADLYPWYHNIVLIYFMESLVLISGVVFSGINGETYKKCRAHNIRPKPEISGHIHFKRSLKAFLFGNALVGFYIFFFFRFCSMDKFYKFLVMIAITLFVLIAVIRHVKTTHEHVKNIHNGRIN